MDVNRGEDGAMRDPNILVGGIAYLPFPQFCNLKQESDIFKNLLCMGCVSSTPHFFR